VAFASQIASIKKIKSLSAIFFDIENDVKRRPCLFNKNVNAANTKKKGRSMRRSASSGSKRNDNGRKRSELWKRLKGKNNTPKRSLLPECGGRLLIPYPPPSRGNKSASPARLTPDLPMIYANNPSTLPRPIHTAPETIRPRAQGKVASLDLKASVHTHHVPLQHIASLLPKHALPEIVDEGLWLLNHHSVLSLLLSLHTVGHRSHRFPKYHRYPFSLPCRLSL